ncbi:Protein SERAC1 [Paramyrothecium foliicola]|nr:Protein SERAC1 [Paramyrothecium foliicola]
MHIVFVHGLGSKFKTTWAYKRKDGENYHWLQKQFPKDMPDARVLVYEYASSWYGDPVHTNLRECARQFLQTLIRDRRHAQSNKLCPTRRTRPMILVGHSFGGLVIKEAMNIARKFSESASDDKYQARRDILAAIAGVVFLGTPHRGSSFSWFASWKSWFGEKILQVQTSDELITILTPSSAQLERLQDDFEETLSDERTANVKLVCYYEMRNVSMLKRMVVEPESATLDKAASRGMDANHMEMNKFYAGDEGRKDSNYDHFLSDVEMIFLEAQTSIPKRFNKWIYGSSGPDEAREILQRALNASREVQDTMLNRFLEIHASAPYTCQWIHDLTAFTEWQAGVNDTKALWINGYGGSGKSVLASYIIHFLRQGTSGRTSPASHDEWSSCTLSVGESTCGARRFSPTVLYFFCGVDRSSETVVRMLGTLVHQLLLAWPENEALFKMASKLVSTVSTTLTRENLIETLAQMASLIGPLYIVVDNLEDMMHTKDDNPSVFLKWLSMLQDQPNIRVLISSQETPELAQSLVKHFQVSNSIDITRHTGGDIQRFTEDRGNAFLSQKPMLCEKRQTIMDSLHSRSKGSFQWVNSAFAHLESVEDAKDIEPELDDIQGDLLDSYDKTFGRLGQNRSPRIRNRIILCLKFIAASATPVTSADLKIAWLVQELLDTKPKRPSDEEFITLFDKKEFEERLTVAEGEIRNYLSSIVDICSDGTLQFKHMSYLKALTRTDAESQHTEAAKFKFSLQQAHRDLSHICMIVCRYTTFVHANSFAEWDTPLVQYAWNFWAYHLEKSKFVFRTVEEAAERRRQMEGSTIEDPVWEASRDIQAAFDSMISGVVYDSLLYMEALMDFISRPLRAVPGHFSDREYVLALQRAQESLLQPAKDLCTLRKFQFDSPSSRLEHQRQKTELARNFPVGGSSLALLRNEAVDKMSNTKAKMLGDKTTVRKLQVDEYLETNSGLPRPHGSPRLMIEAARNLRIVALRFAVDPIYSALLATAGGSSYSPLHPLVYLAQLFEESAMYPYWETLPPGRDIMERFICLESDPEYASAKFVLHCFEWRDPRIDETVMTPSAARRRGFYYRTSHIAIDLRPCPTPNMGLMRVSTENFEQVRRLHQVKWDHIVVAESTYGLNGLFHSNDNFIQNSIFSPLANMHMKYSLLIHEQNEDLLLVEEPQDVLNRHIPQLAPQQSMIKELIRLLPTLLNGWVVNYFVLLLETFGQVAKHALAMHFAKIELAITELKQVTAFFWRIYDSGELPPLKTWYFAPGLFLFILRCRYYPSWGGTYWYHAWGQFSWAWDHPAAYVDMQKDIGFWQLCYNFFMAFVAAAIGNAALILTVQPAQQLKTPLREISFIWSVFHCFCTIDKSFFALASAAATLLACSKVMFTDVESLVNMVKFSLAFWFGILFQLVMTAIRIGAAENGGGVKTMITMTVVHVILMFLFIWYAVPICNFLYGLTKPARVIALWTFRVVLRASVITVKTAGIILVFYLAWRSFSAVHKFIWDPYDVQHSLKTLLQASENVHKALVHGGVRQYKRVGWYPLGEKAHEGQKTLVATARVENGPPRAIAPAEKSIAEAQKSLQEAAGNVVENLGEMFENANFSARIDQAILTTGDQVGRVVDEVSHHVGKVVDDVGAHVGKGLAGGARHMTIQAPRGLLVQQAQAGLQVSAGVVARLLQQQHVLQQLIGHGSRKEALEGVFGDGDKGGLLSGHLGPLSHQLLGAEVGGGGKDLLAGRRGEVLDSSLDEFTWLLREDGNLALVAINGQRHRVVTVLALPDHALELSHEQTRKHQCGWHSAFLHVAANLVLAVEVGNVRVAAVAGLVGVDEGGEDEVLDAGGLGSVCHGLALGDFDFGRHGLPEVGDEEDGVGAVDGGLG